MLTIVILLGVVYLFIYKLPQRAPKMGGIDSQLIGSDCPQSFVFTTIPIDPKKILSVTPLGHLNPPDHTTPTDHIYLVVKENNDVHPEFATEVMSPSDITIQTITKQTITSSGQIQNQDFSIDFSPCSQIQAKFGHVTNLSSKLSSVIKGQGNCQSSHPRPGDDYSYCRYDINLKIPSGESIGEAGGGKATGLDFWVIDYRGKELNFANPTRYNKVQLHTVCPVDLFDKSSKEILRSKFGRYEQKRVAEPLCGEFNQDKLGTAQGNWTTASGYIDRPEAWSKSLSLVHDNVDPTVGIINIGGTIASPTKIQFTPTSSGTTNREFSQVKDGQIYCYKGQPVGLNSQQSGRVLIQLVSNSQLRVENQNGDCESSLNFNSPTLYQR